jgi:hypothetical protein
MTPFSFPFPLPPSFKSWCCRYTFNWFCAIW